MKDVYLIGLLLQIFKRRRYSSSQFLESGNTCKLGGVSSLYELGDPYVYRRTYRYRL